MNSMAQAQIDCGAAKRRRTPALLALPITLLWLCGPAAAAVYHVARPGGCANHAAVGASCNDSGSCTLAQPCCRIQVALDKGVGGGDVVEVHAGTYDAAAQGMTGYTLEAGGTACGTRQAMAVVKPAVVTADAGRRFFRGACEEGGVFGDRSCGTADNQDRPILTDTGGTADVAILLGRTYTDVVRYVTVANFEITGFNGDQNCGNDQNVGTGLETEGHVDHLIVERLWIHDITPQNAYATAIGLCGSSSGCQRSDFITVRGNRVGPNYVGNTMGPHSGEADICYFRGLRVHNNEFESRSANFQVHGSYKAVCGAIYNNVFRSGTAGAGAAGFLHLRQNYGGPSYVFNNYFEGRGNLIYLQCFSTCDRAHLYYFFNNTFIDYDSGEQQIHMIPMEDGGRFVNNLFEDASRATDGTFTLSCDAAYRLGTHGYSAFRSGAYAENNCSFSADLGNHLTGWQRGALTRNAGSSPWPFFALKEGSAAIGKGTSDPIGQGPGKCLIDWQSTYGCDDPAAETCAPIDCTRDFNGDLRGASWDIGADEYHEGDAVSPAPPSGLRAQ